MVKIVLDTNVVISGIIADGLSANVLEESINSDRLTPVVSPDLLTEYRQKCNQIEAISVKARYATIQALKKNGEIVYPEENLKIVEDDPDDDKLFEVAIEADAKYIISGDKQHVLPVGKFEEKEVITPRQASEKLQTD